MNLEGRILFPILRQMEEKRNEKSAEADSRCQEIYKIIPRISEIDTELKTTMLSIMKAAFSENKDPEKLIEEIREKNLKLQAEKAELLVEAGFSFDYMDIRYGCKDCNDTGYIGNEPCKCLLEKYKAAQALELSQLLIGNSENFDSFELDNFSAETDKDFGISQRDHMTDIYDFCVEYANHFSKNSENLFFTGSSGTGKTFLSACLANAIVEKGFSVVYDTAFNIFLKFEEEKFNRESGLSKEDTKRYMNCDLLILDDLGTEMTTSFTVSVFFNLINFRLISEKKTIIVSNLSLAEIRKRYSEPIYSRINGEYFDLTFFGDDIRRKMRK